jgi:hypothetical protein
MKTIMKTKPKNKKNEIKEQIWPFSDEAITANLDEDEIYIPEMKCGPDDINCLIATLQDIKEKME